MSKLITSYATEVANVNFYDETLYIRRDGSWFVSYADSISLIELSDDEAFEWMKRNDCADEIERYFPDRVEDA